MERATPQDPPGAMNIVYRKHPLPRIAALLVLLVVLLFVYFIVKSGTLSWHIVGFYLFDKEILLGLKVTIILTVASMVLGTLAAIVIASMHIARNPLLKNMARLYIWFFRGTPLLLQMIFWFNIALFIPQLSLGGYSIATNDIITPMGAAILALSLNEAAYMAEIIRGGVLAVPKGQAEAAFSLGLTPVQSSFHVISGQVIKIILPTFGNQTIGMLKTTSLVAVIAAQDLLTKAEEIYSGNYRVIELLMVAGIWYLLMTTLCSGLQYLLERRLTGKPST